MELKRALELRTEYSGSSGIIRVNADDYICLNDIASFFPSKRLDHWLLNDAVKELICSVEKIIIPGKSGIIAKRGKGGGTYAHELIAMDFAAWLSPEFKIIVYQAYINGTQQKKHWNLKRVLAAHNFKILTSAIKDSHDPVKSYHYSNEALLLNEIVFGERNGELRDTATEKQLDAIASLEGHNATMIGLKMPYEERKEKLKIFYTKMSQREVL